VGHVLVNRRGKNTQAMKTMRDQYFDKERKRKNKFAVLEKCLDNPQMLNIEAERVKESIDRIKNNDS
jgi:hypothetical protein